MINGEILIKSLIYFWNLVYYCFFRLQLGIHSMFKLINPINYFLKIPSVRKSFEEKRGINDISEYVEKSAFDNREVGVPVISGGIHSGILLGSIECICFNIIQLFFGKNWMNSIFDNELIGLIYILCLFLTTSLFNYFILFKNKRYLTYFNQFDKIPKKKITLYCSICLFVYISTLVLVVYSFTWLKNI
jgi:hypothetical protein